METMGAAGDGLYRRLWAVRARSNQRCALTGSWATPPTTGFIHIERGGEPYGTIDHGDLRGKTPSLLAPLAGGSPTRHDARAHNIVRDAKRAGYRLIRAGGAALGAETRHIAKIERGTGPRHWEAANKKKQQ
jgi:hypothetical protein